MLFSMVRTSSLKPLKNSFLILLLLGFGFNSFSQNIDYIALDNLGNTYTVSQTDTLSKYLPSGSLSYIYSNKSLGKIGAINTQNPLKILASHPGLSTLVVLDVTLRETGRIFLPDIGIFSDSVAFCLSVENNIYIYDDFEQQVVLVTEDGTEISRGPSLIQEVDYPPRVSSMAFSRNTLFLNDPEKGVLMLDQFGKYIKTIPVKGIEHFQVFGDTLYYLENNELVSYHTNYISKKSIHTFKEPVSQAIIGNKRLLALQNGQLLLIGK